MILYPAIDLKDGHCVRFYKGEMDQATVFSDDPAAQAASFADAGCDWIHLVEAILARVKVTAQLGGGIRDMATIEAWLSKGLARVILGTVAIENPALVREAARAFPGQVAVGIDARDSRVVTKGWAEETDVIVTDLARAVTIPTIASGGVSSFADLIALRDSGVIDLPAALAGLKA